MPLPGDHALCLHSPRACLLGTALCGALCQPSRHHQLCLLPSRALTSFHILEPSLKNSLVPVTEKPVLILHLYSPLLPRSWCLGEGLVYGKHGINTHTRARVVILCIQIRGFSLSLGESPGMRKMTGYETLERSCLVLACFSGLFHLSFSVPGSLHFLLLPFAVVPLHSRTWPVFFPLPCPLFPVPLPILMVLMAESTLLVKSYLHDSHET